MSRMHQPSAGSQTHNAVEKSIYVNAMQLTISNDTLSNAHTKQVWYAVDNKKNIIPQKKRIKESAIS